MRPSAVEVMFITPTEGEMFIAYFRSGRSGRMKITCTCLSELCINIALAHQDHLAPSASAWLIPGTDE